MRFNNIICANNSLSNKDNIFNYSVKNFKNIQESLEKYKSYKAVLIVNTASNWGLANKNFSELDFTYN